MLADVAREIPFYHITEINNLISILENSGLYSEYENKRKCIIPVIIGYTNVKSIRSTKIVSERFNYTVNQYVPFYFTVRSPMLYVIYKRNPNLTYRLGQRSIIYLVSKLHYLINHNIHWYFTDMNAADSLATFYDNLDDLDKVDWKAVKALDWSNYDIKAKKQAEVLVYKYFPWEYIDEIVVYNEMIQQKVLEIFQNFPSCIKPIRIDRSWYYD